jgi:hypothetical protein
MFASSFSGLADYRPTNIEPGQYGLHDFPRQRVFQPAHFRQVHCRHCGNIV